MPLSLYSASVPVFRQLLGGLNDVLSKALLHCESADVDAAELLQSRLFPDMFPLYRQVQIATDFATGVCARLAGVEVPGSTDQPQSIEDLKARIADTLSFIESLPTDAFEGAEQREILLRPGTPKERKLGAQAYLLSYGLPQFFFHVTTAYALLRHCGVEIGKRDYMGAY